MRETHDLCVRPGGGFDQAIAMIQRGKQLGYSVCTNTTIFRETSMDEIEQMCELLTGLGIDGIMISPGYHYENVKENHFLYRDEIHSKFETVLALSKRYPISLTPLFLEFAAGKRDYPCTPWGNVTRTPFGWKDPCYLVGKRYFQTWDAFWNGVDWDYWERREDEACQNCFMHSGFEASVMRKLPESPRDMLTMAKWMLSA